MLRTILENQRVILEALRDGTDTGWITSEIDKRIESTSDELSKLHQPTVSGAWLSPVKSEREWQEKHILKIFPSYPNSSPNWQVLNGLIRFSCHSLNIKIDEP